MRIRGLLILAVFILVRPAYAVDVKAVVTEVNDRRSTGQFFNDLEVKLKLLGDDAASVRGIRTAVRTAVDDTGRNLLSGEKKGGDFEAVDAGGQAEVTLKLKNPARKATVIKEIAGDLELFMPDQDPGAAVVVEGILKTGASPLDSQALKEAGVSVTVLTKKDYEALRKAEEKKAKEQAEKQGLEEAAMKMLEGLFGSLFQVGENDLVLKVDDPSAKVIQIEAADAGGARINSYGRMKSDDLVILNYGEPLPPDARLRIFLKTEKSVVSVPLKLTDVVLP
jgi:hypothetical protein